MNTNDVLYPVVDQRPMSCLVVNGLGQYWDWTAGAYANPAMPFDPKRFALDMTPDKVSPEIQRAVIPAKAASEPTAVLVIAAKGAGGMPRPDHACWLGLFVAPEGVPVSAARGISARFIP